jgi:hypothetical protein
MAGALRSPVFRKFLGPLIFWPLYSFAQTINLDSRFENHQTRNDLGVFSAYFNIPATELLSFHSAGRISLSAKDFEGWGYARGARLAWLPFFANSVRLSQENWLGPSTANSTILFLGEIEGHPFGFLDLFLNGGWYRRFITLNKALFLPGFVGSNFSEHDFAVNFGLGLHWSDSVSTLFKVATFDEVSVYNLNNPFIHAELSFIPLDNLKVTLYSRYKLLLGFGRLDSFTVGVSLPLSLKGSGHESL